MAEPSEIELESALLQTSAPDCILAAVFEDEQPPLRIAGKLDWKSHGFISALFKEKKLKGTKGELTLIPLAYFPNKIVKVLTVGFGTSHSQLSPTDKKSLRDQIKHLKLKKVALSKSDFGSIDLGEEISITWIV